MTNYPLITPVTPSYLEHRLTFTCFTCNWSLIFFLCVRTCVTGRSPQDRVCSIFSNAGKFCIAHGLRQFMSDVKSDVYIYIYSQLSLSRLRLSRITAYLEEKIWSLVSHRNLKSGYKILWKRGEIAPGEQFLPFSTIFSIYISN